VRRCRDALIETQLDPVRRFGDTDALLRFVAAVRGRCGSPENDRISVNSTMTAKGKAKRKRRSRKEPEWVQLPDEELLDLRLCDLELQITGTPLEERIDVLYDELEHRGIRFRPHCWLSDEWFSPDGVPGIAIPFYLAHPKLAALERRQMLEVEGGTEDQCMRILRHEAGHAIDTAYRLHRRPSWRRTFGKYSQPYPDTYHPRPYSRSYVLHLDMWYAQSHPAEDFAETFAVWLRPRSRWRTQYRGWPAMKKIEYVDRLINEIADRPATVRSRRHVEPLRKLTHTLREHYDAKRERYGVDYPEFYDRDLRRLFSAEEEHARCESAAAFLRRHRTELRRSIAYWTGEYQYTIDQVLGEMIQRCRELNLRRDRPESHVRRDAMLMLTVQTMNYLHGGHHRVAL